MFPAAASGVFSRIRSRYDMGKVFSCVCKVPFCGPHSPEQTEQTQTLTEQTQTLTEQTQTLTEQTQTLTEQTQTLTEQTVTLTTQTLTEQTLTEQTQTLTEQANSTAQSDPDEDSHRPLQTQSPPHGLRNHGATCFLNSVLQVLFMTPELHQSLELLSNQTDTSGVLKRLFDKLKKEPSGTEELLRHLNITEQKQRDAAEHLELLLNRLSPEVSEPFSGHTTEKTMCSEGHCVGEETSDFWTLPLPLEHISGCSVTKALQLSFTESTLTDVYCDDCQKKTTALCSCELTKPPQILLLLLKRFDLNPRGQYYKSQCEVELSASLSTQVNCETVWYSLSGVVDHWGSVRGGHYTCTLLSPEDHRWYYFSDLTVHQVQAPSGQK